MILVFIFGTSDGVFKNRLELIGPEGLKDGVLQFFFNDGFLSLLYKIWTPCETS